MTYIYPSKINNIFVPMQNYMYLSADLAIQR